MGRKRLNIERYCLNCGKTFFVIPSRGNSAKSR